MADGTAKPVIFISYSHKDEPEHPRDGEVQWLSFVRTYLQPAIKNGIFDLFVDEHLSGGDNLTPEIERKLHACDIFIPLISANSTASDYIIDTEIRVTRDREAAGDEVCFYPILLMPTPKIALDKFKDKVIRPRDAKPLLSFPYGERIQKMTEIADEIATIAAEIVRRKPQPPKPGAQPSYVHIGGLPETPYERLVGRDAELKYLNEAWFDTKTNILSLIAEGGAGKSALINEWLKRLQIDSYCGAESVLGWSFYSQGSKERATSAEEFLNWALDKLGIKLASTSATAKGEAIAEAMMRRRVLLVLDGVEPLQHGLDTQLGQLKDQGLRALLRRFAAASPVQVHGLIVLTSRLAVKDIARWRDGGAPVTDVERLSDEAGAALLHDHGLWASDGPGAAATSPSGGHRVAPHFPHARNWQKGPAPVEYIERLSDEAGAALLRDNNAWGTDNELRAASRDFGGHPLALSLLASFLNELHYGDVRRRDRIRVLLDDPNSPGHDHARRVMESYEQEWLAHEPVLLAIMTIVGLFERPASPDCLAALRKQPAIAGLTGPIVNLKDTSWRRAIARLREVRLLDPEDPSTPDSLDAHPLVREWFGERLRHTDEIAWKAAHGRLYEHLRDTTREGDEPALEELARLYQAIAHGCQADRYQEAFDQIYGKRISRLRRDGEPAYYSINTLGAFGSDLAALSWFFERPYAVPASGLSRSSQMVVQGLAGTFLRVLGRTTEAISAEIASLKMAVDIRDWANAAIGAFNLTFAAKLVGDLAYAEKTAAQSKIYAERCAEKRMSIDAISNHAYALFVMGNPVRAKELFRQCEQMQEEMEGEASRFLYTQRGYDYCELLLSISEWKEVYDRGVYTIKIAERNGWFGHVAQDSLSIGCALLGMSLQSARYQETSSFKSNTLAAAEQLDNAIEGLRSAAQIDNLPRGFIARAALRRSTGDWDSATRDLDEVEEIAEPGPMRLYLCDTALERARLVFAKIEAFAPLNGMLEKDNPSKPTVPSAAQITDFKSEAEKQLKIAAEYIEKCGYHRRDEELAELQAVLRGEKKFADLPPRV